MWRLILMLALAAGCDSSSNGSTPDGNISIDGPPNSIDAPRSIDGPNSNDASTSIDAPPNPDGSTGGTDYGRDGTDTVTTFTASVNTGVRTFNETVYLPGSAGAHPAVVLAPGLAQPATAYHDYGQRLASHGIITLIRDDPNVVEDSTAVAADISYVVATWLPAENTGSGMLAGKVDLAHIGLAGHSRGGKSTLLAAEMGAMGKVSAWFGLDAIDATLFSGGNQAVDRIGTIGIPTAQLGTAMVTPCSPTAYNYQVLYAAASSPSVALLGVNSGHTQLEDQTYCVACGVCTPMGTADSQTVLHYSVKYLTAFFARELKGDTNVGATFDGAGVQADIAAGLITMQSK
jgi:hypothetical protein